jgi:hypothetical protein
MWTLSRLQVKGRDTRPLPLRVHSAAEQRLGRRRGRVAHPWPKNSGLRPVRAVIAGELPPTVGALRCSGGELPPSDLTLHRMGSQR